MPVYNTSQQAIPSNIYSGSKSVTVAGTAEALVAVSTPCSKVFLTTNDTNTGKIYWGNASVSSTNGDYIFPASKIAVIEIDDLNKIYIDADVSGEGVKFTYLV